MTSHRSYSFVLAACAACLALQSPAQAQLPGLEHLIDGAKGAKKMGESFRKIEEPEEIQLGGNLAGLILGASPLIQDPEKQHYVNRLGRWLALHSERPNLPWKFGIVETADVNAFSMPGGYVLISRGMFDRMRNEAELAGVLSHEIAHVVQRHHLKALQKSLRSSAFGDFSKSFAPGGGLTAAFATALLNAGKDLLVKGLDKEDEYEADRMGVIIAARSGYSPYGLVGVLQTLSAAPDTKGFALMNKTHPLPVKRIERLDSAMGTRLDSLVGLVDDLPSFVQLRSPPLQRTPARRRSR